MIGGTRMTYNPDHKHNFMAEGLMIPFANQTDANRMQMFNSHSGQMIQLVHGEQPLVFTGFENQIGKYSTGYKQNKETDKLVVKKFIKNPFVYYLLVYDTKTKEYDIIERKESEVLTEYYAAKYDNTVLDSLEQGDTIPTDTVLYHDCNYDGDLNFKYGKNINVAYISYKGYTNEDAIIISESAAKDMSSYFCQDVEVNINTNDVLLNLYGDEETYKTFPSIGETVREEDGILLSIRKVVYTDIINKLKDDQLTKKLDGDIHFYASRHAKVIDLDIFSNTTDEKLQAEHYNCQVVEELTKLRAFYKEVVDELGAILKKKNVKYTNALRDFYNRIAEYADPMTEFEKGGRRFDNLILRFRILWEKPLAVGSKITQRYGGKGVLAKIVPDDEMPVLNHLTLNGEKTPVREDTKLNLRASVAINSQGIFNRLG